ncbi:MAG: DUF2318 domain-containing protein [Synergistaceae bacterium]|nr:DUF2318 domain-containing protein [Synergistaceae bacterium]
MLGIILNLPLTGSSSSRKKYTVIFAVLGIIAGCCVFGVRMYDPRGMNLLLMRFNRRLVVAIACVAVLSVLTVFFRKLNALIVSVMLFLSLMYLVPPVMQYTREFVYFGESGISTNAMLRALGFTLGLITCLLLVLGAYEVHGSLRSDRERRTFLFASLFIFACEYAASAVAALQRLRVLKTSDSLFGVSVFDVMIWRDANQNAFLFAQLALALVMLSFVILTHRTPEGIFPNRALLRKEKARLRDCRRWSWSLGVFWMLAVFIVIVLHYYDTKPPAEIQPEPYDMEDGIISIALDKVSDGHLHKFSYVTPNKYDVRFLVVKKPAGTAYGVGLDACDICGLAGYYERGDEEVICRRCDVVMNKNTIGFKGGCNPVPFEYEIRGGKIYIDVKELEKHETRFK